MAAGGVLVARARRRSKDAAEHTDEAHDGASHDGATHDGAADRDVSHGGEPEHGEHGDHEEHGKHGGKDDGGSRGLKGRYRRLKGRYRRLMRRAPGSQLRGSRLRRAALVLGVVLALLLIAGIIAVFTVGDDDASTALPSELLGEQQVESDMLNSAAMLVSEPLDAAGLEDLQTRFYGSSASSPAVFVARGAVPGDVENPRTVLDAVERAVTEVYETSTLSAARPPGGDGIRCAGTNLPDAGQSTVCAFEQDGSVVTFTLFSVPPGQAESSVMQVRDQVLDAG